MIIGGVKGYLNTEVSMKPCLPHTSPLPEPVGIKLAKSFNDTGSNSVWKGLCTFTHRIDFGLIFDTQTVSLGSFWYMREVFISVSSTFSNHTKSFWSVFECILNLKLS